MFTMLVDGIGPRLTGVARAQARRRLGARDAREVGPQQRAARAVRVRPRLAARQVHDRDGRAALHAAARLRRGVESVDAGRGDRAGRRRSPARRRTESLAGRRSDVKARPCMQAPIVDELHRDRSRAAARVSPMRRRRAGAAAAGAAARAAAGGPAAAPRPQGGRGPAAGRRRADQRAARTAAAPPCCSSRAAACTAPCFVQADRDDAQPIRCRRSCSPASTTT